MTHGGANESLRRTPRHATTGCGAFQRRAPTGGAANGSALKTRRAGLDSTLAATAPPVTVTVSRAAT